MIPSPAELLAQPRTPAFTTAESARDHAASDKKRRSTVAFVDMVGYSRLVAADDMGTLKRWRLLLANVFFPTVPRYAGRIVKITGDELLLEFEEPHRAFECLLSIQLEIWTHNKDLPAAERMEFRAAINVATVVDERSDLYGSDVNIAARLTPLADPSGIVLSDSVMQAIRGLFDSKFEDLGLLQLKNIPAPVRGFRWTPLESATTLPRSRLDRLVHNCPSIAVLPFEELSREVEDEYFGEGITEDIITSLSSLHELFVISRSSMLVYRGLKVDVAEVSRALGVRYILSGSVRRSGGRIRISMTLTDCQTSENLWSDRLDAPEGDLFEIQDTVVSKVVAGIAPRVQDAELAKALRRAPDSFSAYELTLQALYQILRLNRAGFERAGTMLERAIELDPEFAMPYAWAARWHNIRIGQGWSRDKSFDSNCALTKAAKAIELDPNNALALATYGHLTSYLGHDCKSALEYLERALIACPNHSIAWVLSSATLGYLGRTKEAVRHAEHGVRLSPFDRNLFYYYSFLSFAHYSDGTIEEAVKWGRLAIRENPFYTAAYRYLIAALSAFGELDEAASFGSDLKRLEPEFRVNTLEKAISFWNDNLRQRFISDLRSARLLD